MNEIHQSIIEDAVDTFGIENQMRMLQEECGELIVAVGHYLRNRENARENLIEELADVKIMSEQIIYALAIDKNVKIAIDKKLCRLANRLSEKRSQKEQ